MEALLNGHLVYYEDSGCDGAPVVFLHSIAGSSADWAGVRRLLPRRVRSIAYDARGIGRSRSDGVAATFTMDDLVRDLEALLDHLSISRACIVGASMGGGVAQHFGIQRPERVDELVLLSTSSTFPASLRDRFLDDAERVTAQGMDALVDDLIERWLDVSYRDSHPVELAELRGQYLATPPDVFARRCRVNAERNLTARLQELRCPVLVVAGAADPSLDITTLRTYLDELPDCEAHVLGKSSHCVEREVPDRLARLVEWFVLSRRSL